MKDTLFSDFPPSRKSDWKAFAEKELKSQISKVSEWQIASGLFTESYQTADDIDPGKVSEMQLFQKKDPGWLHIAELDPEGLLQYANSGSEGQDGFWFDCRNSSLFENTDLLKDPGMDKLFIVQPSWRDVIGYFSTDKKSPYLSGWFLAFDPVAEWIQNGVDPQEYVNGLAAALKSDPTILPARTSVIRSDLHYEKGADPVQELAFALASLTTYMDLLTEAGISAEVAARKLFFSLSTGTHYLTDIAKLRAFRYLLAKIWSAYDIPFEIVPFIHVRTSALHYQQKDPYNNLVRATIAAMSAIGGGCDAFTVTRFDILSKKSTSFSERISRNISLLSQYESRLSEVADPAAGSYLLENMSISIADSAWNLFLRIENMGGITECVRQGFIHDQFNDCTPNIERV